MRTARSVWSASSLLAFLLLTGWSSFAATPDPIDLFQHLAGKTVLMPSDLARPTQPLPELGTNQADAAAKLESYLLTNGITAIHDGPRFLRLLPTRRVDELLTNAPLRAQQLKPSSDSNTIPAGMITILNVNIDDILAIYAELRNRTILRPAKLPHARLNLKTETALTLQEAVYAMDTVLALNGLSVVEDGIKFVQLVPASQKASIKPNAPPADLSAELVNPKEMPYWGWTNRSPKSSGTSSA